MSGRLITIDKADLNALYNSAFTALGAGLISTEVLLALLSHMKANNTVPVILECYRLKDSLEIPVLEFGFTYPFYQEMCQGLSKQDQVLFMLGEIYKTLDLLDSQTDLFGFDIWFE